jgi:hypothetical protein
MLDVGMPREKIHMTRFRWKTPAWRELSNIRSIWLYSQDGLLSFEIELDSKVKIPNQFQVHARNSKNSSWPNFIMLKDRKVLASLSREVKSLRVRGARGKAVYLGKLEYSEKGQTYSFPLYSTLADWQDFKGYTAENLPKVKTKVQFT